MAKNEELPMIEQKGKSFRLTDHGFMYVTQLLIDEGYMSPEAPEGFESNQLFAGIMGSRMVEAADRYLKRLALLRDRDDEELIVLLGLYSLQAQTEVDRASKGFRQKRAARRNGSE